MQRYDRGMIETPVPFPSDGAPSPSDDAIETVLRAELAQGDAMIGSITPILRHLLSSEDHSVFSDEIVARVRGSAGDVARQLLAEAGQGQDGEPGNEPAAPALEALTHELIAAPAFLAHLHSSALEWQLTQRLQSRLSLDPVLSPLLQALIASSDAVTAGLAMNLLAAQSRFVQNQRRMRLPLGELPGDLLHTALLAMRALADNDEAAAAAESAIRERYDEGRSRLGLMARLITGMGGGAVAALAVSHAGVALFASALALASGQDRDLAILSTNDGQLARLALALRAAGLKPAGVAEQFVALHPEVTLPEGIDALGSDRAASILALAGAYNGQ